MDALIIIWKRETFSPQVFYCHWLQINRGLYQIWSTDPIGENHHDHHLSIQLVARYETIAQKILASFIFIRGLRWAHLHISGDVTHESV
jgi:hypothetical protein